MSLSVYRRFLPLLWLVGSLYGLVSCNKTDDAPIVPPPPAPSAVDTLRYLALGDSYTIGESVSEQARFPVQLVDSLRRDQFVIGAPTIVARTGWTTSNLSSSLQQTVLPTDTFDLVTLLIGVNNQFRGQSLANYRLEFTALLERAIALAGNRPERVVVVSIPDYAFTPFGQQYGPDRISRELDQFNAANRAITAQYNGTGYVDITPVSRQGLAEPVLVAGDGLHPSGEQYRRWVMLLLPTVRARLME